MIDYNKYLAYIHAAAEAHQEKVLPTARAFRTFPTREKNPYFIHPLWCSTMLLCESTLPENIREDAAIALLFHDVLEDTSAELPSDLSPLALRLIHDMTYENFAEEVEQVLAKDSLVHLVKLYDKVATLYDGVLRTSRHVAWIDFTEKLIARVEEAYGQLNIVVIGKALCEKYKKTPAEETFPHTPQNT